MKKTLLFTLLLMTLSVNLFSQEKTDSDSKRMKPALIVMDIQNAYLPMMDEADQKMGPVMINYMIDLFRTGGYPIITIYHQDLNQGPEPGTEGFKFPDTIKILTTDPVVIKHRASGFKETDLDKILKEKGINTLFITGLSAVGCALATYIEAGDLGYNTFFVKYSLLSHDHDYTKKIEEMFGAVNYDVVRTMLDNAVK